MGFAIGDGNHSLLCKTPQSFGLNLSNATDESIETAIHPHEIQPADDIIIHLDYLHSGLGSNSCGEEQLEEYKVKIQDFAMSFSLQAVNEGEEIARARRKTIGDV